MNTNNESEQFGVLHCLAGFYARQNGADTACQAAANIAHEVRELGLIKEWPTYLKIGPLGWFLDTQADFELFFAGAAGLNSAEECVPGQCTKTPKKK